MLFYAFWGFVLKKSPKIANNGQFLRLVETKPEQVIQGPYFFLFLFEVDHPQGMPGGQI